MHGGEGFNDHNEEAPEDQCIPNKELPDEEDVYYMSLELGGMEIIIIRRDQAASGNTTNFVGAKLRGTTPILSTEFKDDGETVHWLGKVWGDH